MALSQIACLDNNHVNPRTNDSKPDFIYCEDQRLALEALLQDGREAFFKYLEARGLRGFLSDPEMEALAGTYEPHDPDSELIQGNAEDDGAPMSLHYWPDMSDTSIPMMDLGWPDTEAYRGVTRTSVYAQPPLDGQPHVKEIVRKMIGQALKVIAVAMDVFTDVDIFRDLLEVAFKKKVSVYILLESTNLPHFLSMCQRANMHPGHLKHLRVRYLDGAEFYTRSSTKVTGRMAQRFMFIDGDRAVSGSYSYTWLSSRLDRNLITVVSGQAVETYDNLFRILYAVSSSVDITQCATDLEPEPEPIKEPAPAPPPPSAEVVRKRHNPKYALVALSYPSPSPADDQSSTKENQEPEVPEMKKMRRMSEDSPIHPGLVNLEKVCLMDYVPTWPEPDPPSDVIGFINVRDSTKPNVAHLQRSEMYETSQAVRFSNPISVPKESLPEVAKPRQLTAEPKEMNHVQTAVQDKTNVVNRPQPTQVNALPGNIKGKAEVSGPTCQSDKGTTKTFNTENKLNTNNQNAGPNTTPHQNAHVPPQSNSKASAPNPVLKQTLHPITSSSTTVSPALSSSSASSSLTPTSNPPTVTPHTVQPTETPQQKKTGSYGMYTDRSGTTLVAGTNPKSHSGVLIADAAKAKCGSIQEIIPKDVEPKTLTSKDYNLSQKEDGVAPVQKEPKAPEKALIGSDLAEVPKSTNVKQNKTSQGRAYQLQDISYSNLSPQDIGVLNTVQSTNSVGNNNTHTAAADTNSQQDNPSSKQANCTDSVPNTAKQNAHGTCAEVTPKAQMSTKTPEKSLRLNFSDTHLPNLRSLLSDRESLSLTALARTPTPDGIPSRTPTPDSRTNTPDGYFSPREDSTSDEYYECCESPLKEPVTNSSVHLNHNAVAAMLRPTDSNTSSREKQSLSAKDLKEAAERSRDAKRKRLKNQAGGLTNEGAEPKGLSTRRVPTAREKAEKEKAVGRAALRPSGVERRDKHLSVRDIDAQKPLYTLPTRPQGHQQDREAFSLTQSTRSTRAPPLSTPSLDSRHWGGSQASENAPSHRRMSPRHSSPGPGSNRSGSGHKQAEASHNMQSFLIPSRQPVPTQARPRKPPASFLHSIRGQQLLGHSQNQTTSAQKAHSEGEGQAPFSVTFGRLYSLKDLKDKMSQLPGQSKKGRASSPANGRKGTR